MSEDNILDGTVEGEATPAGDEVNNGEAAVEVPEFLKDMELDNDIKTSRTLQNHKSVADVVKSYVHQSKLVGADKIIKPGKDATDDEWKAVFTKLGLPGEVDKYELHRGTDSAVDEKFFNEFRAKAHEAGILPSQASKLMSFFEEQGKSAASNDQAHAEIQAKKDLEALQEEWGGAFKGNVNRANYAVKKFGGEDFVKFLGDSNLGSNPQVIKFMAKVGEAMGEDNILGESTTQNTPAQALARINSIKSDPTHPYWKGDAVAKAEMEELSKEAYGAE